PQPHGAAPICPCTARWRCLAGTAPGGCRRSAATRGSIARRCAHAVRPSGGKACRRTPARGRALRRASDAGERSLTMLLLGLRLMLDLRAARSVFLCAQVVQDSAGRKDQPIGGRRSPYPARVIVPPCRVAPTDSTICELTPTRGHGCAQEGYP